MIKFLAHKPDGSKVFGFGFSETNMERLKFNREPIFFDFSDLDTPGYFGLVVYQDEFDEEELQNAAASILNPSRGVTVETLRAFVLPESAYAQMLNGLGFSLNVKIESPGDTEIFFAGKNEQQMQELLQAFIGSKTKFTSKGFG